MMIKGKVKVMWFLKAILASYIISGCLLLLFTYFVYKVQLAENIVVAGIMVIYFLSTLVGGYIIGRLTQQQKYMWGMVSGFVYFFLLMMVSIGVYRGFGTNGVQTVFAGILCVAGGMIGGMVAS